MQTGGANEAVGRERYGNILCEKPLDRVDLENDFSTLSGRLRIDSTGIQYYLGARVATSFTNWRVVRDFVDIRPEDILQVRFGGTRFTGIIAWVDIVYRTPSGPRYVSFADAREPHAVDTYNRIFDAAANLQIASRAAPVSPVQAGQHTRR